MKLILLMEDNTFENYFWNYLKLLMEITSGNYKNYILKLPWKLIIGKFWKLLLEIIFENFFWKPILVVTKSI